MNTSLSINSHNSYITAGEFADLASTTKHTLFHYDEIGLFPPAFRAENGYRYYSFEQLETFHVISALRELGMSLSDIKKYLNQKSPSSFLSLIAHEEMLLDQKIRKLQKIRKWLREKADQLETFGDKKPGTVEILTFPEQYYISSYSPSLDEKNLFLKLKELYGCCREKGYRSSYNVGYIQHREKLSQGIFHDYHESYLLFDDPPDKLPYTCKPGGSYLCTYYKGHWKDIGSAYHLLFEHAEKHGLSLDSVFYEDYILDELTMKKEQDYLTMISVHLSSF